MGKSENLVDIPCTTLYGHSMTTDTININPIPASELAERIAKPIPRARRSKGFKIVEEFLHSGNVAAVVTAPDKVERDRVLVSIKTYLNFSAQGRAATVWAKVSSPTEILLINIDKADEATRKAYENRPKAGRPKNQK